MSKIKVSSEFIDIYKCINTKNQVESINLLSEYEKYLLLAIIFDNIEVSDFVLSNLEPFETYIDNMEKYYSSVIDEIDDELKKQLKEIESLSSDDIIDIINPPSEQEAIGLRRELNISNILK